MTLYDELVKNDKKGLFKRTPTSISYPTGFPTVDYRNGYILKAYDNDDNVIEESTNIGIVSGTFNTVIGRSATAKTTGVVQMAYNIIKPFPDGLIYHADLENSFSMSRAKDVTNMSIGDLKTRYVLKQDTVFIEDLFETIMTLYHAKMNNKDKYQYKTGILDEFGEEIVQFVPTVFILDSIPSIAMKSTDEMTEMQSETLVTKRAKYLAQFYRTLGPYIKQANIIVFAINHITDKIEINAFAKSQAQTMYLKMHEQLPGGISPIYYANNIFKFVSNTKFTEEKDGFDGFNIKCELIKSRTNKAGQYADLVYDQRIGFSYARTMLSFIKDMKMLNQRNPHSYFKGYDHIKFSTKNFPEVLAGNKELQQIMTDIALPYLRSYLSTGDESERVIDQFEIMTNLVESLENEDEHVPVTGDEE